MAILKPGAAAPAFTLPDLRGAPQSLQALLAQGPVLLAFFKVSCPTCQYTFPFLERFRNSPARIFGISQDNQRSTEQFNRQFGVTFPVLLDAASEDYPVSNAYGLTHVPSLVWVEPDGKISLASVGFVKADLEAIARRAGAVELFHKDERVEAFRAG
jgi:peroxiredoxin